MSKLEKFIAEQNAIIEKAEKFREKGYGEFFDKVATLHFKTSSDRDVLVEYFVVSMISFFNDNGVDYNISLEGYKKNFDVSLSDGDIINRFKNGIKNASTDIQNFADDKVYINQEGLLSFNAILYGIQTIAGMREKMVSFFGEKLISEEIFPDLEKIQATIVTVTKMATDIVERRKINSLEGEQLLERAIAENPSIANSTSIIEEINSKLELIKEKVKQNKIYTLENHPNYRELEKELESHIKTRDETIDELSQTSPASLKAYLILTLGLEDYENMYKQEQLAQEMELVIEENGIDPDTAIIDLKQTLTRLECELEAILKSKQYIALCDAQVAALQALMASPITADFYEAQEALEIASKTSAEKMQHLQTIKDNLTGFQNSYITYNGLGFLARQTSRGQLLKMDILRIPELEQEEERVETELEEASAIESSARDAYNAAKEKYGALFDSLNGDENHSLAQALSVSDKDQIFILSKDDLMQCHNSCSQSLFYENEKLENKPHNEHELRAMITNEKNKLADLELVVKQRQLHDELGDEFFAMLELAMSLTTDETDEATNETGHSYTLK